MMRNISRRKVLTGSVTAYAVTGLGLTRSNATTQTVTTHKVVIKKFRFMPEVIDVRIGDTITWINQDIAPHTASADAKDWSTKTLKKGQSESLLVTGTLSHTYYCKFHPQMKGQINVISE